MPSFSSFSFQDFSSSSMWDMVNLYNHISVIMLSVMILITYLMVFLLLNHYSYKFLSEGIIIETIWSLVPAFILLILVIPSMKILYLVESNIKFPHLTLKIVAHQWYWTYIIPFFDSVVYHFMGSTYNVVEYDSMMETNNDFPRLLGCSSFLLIPFQTPVRLIITSMDVIHSFALPSLGLKVDAVPGWLNQLFTFSNRMGIYFGQCSEICGSNHSFMPIGVKILPVEDYDKLCLTFLLDNIN